MAALVLVLVVPVFVSVLVRMSHGLVAVLMTVVGMRFRRVGVLMGMLVFIVAAHRSALLSFKDILILIIIGVTVNLPAPGGFRNVNLSLF
jgi:hypothetical protein